MFSEWFNEDLTETVLVSPSVINTLGRNPLTTKCVIIHIVSSLNVEEQRRQRHPAQ